MNERKFEIADIVQIIPNLDTEVSHRYGGQFVFVTSPKVFGLQGYFFSAPEGTVTYEGKAFIRLKFEDVEYVGQAPFVEEELLKEEE